MRVCCQQSQSLRIHRSFVDVCIICCARHLKPFPGLNCMAGSDWSKVCFLTNEQRLCIRSFPEVSHLHIIMASLIRCCRWHEPGVEDFVVVVVVVVGCLTSQQHASVSQGRICSDSFTCCHTETEVANPTLHLTRSQYTDTGPTSPSTNPITPGAWQGSQWSASFFKSLV